MIETVWIPLSDGSWLAARIWLPAHARERPDGAVMEYIPWPQRLREHTTNEGIGNRDSVLCGDFNVKTALQSGWRATPRNTNSGS